jgi:hypothetical protein
MIGTHEFANVTARFGADDRTTVTTNVVQRVNLPFITANDDHPIDIDFDEEIVSDVWNLTRMPGEQPSGSPDSIEILPVDSRVLKKGLRQRPTRPASSDERLDCIGRLIFPG